MRVLYAPPECQYGSVEGRLCFFDTDRHNRPYALYELETALIIPKYPPALADDVIPLACDLGEEALLRSHEDVRVFAVAFAVHRSDGAADSQQADMLTF
jgi:hypothetical protein